MQPPQETGFLNRRVELNGVSYKFQVYLPEDYRRDDGKLWPVILFLHGRGERGSEGMWQTQIGLPAEVRDHPERWPFVIVMPQCPIAAHWTDPIIMTMAMTALDQMAEEFHGDPDRTYLTGLSLGGYGAWELATIIPTAGPPSPLLPGASFGVTPPSAGNKPPPSPPSTPRQWDAHPSGFSTAARTLWCHPAKVK